MKQSQEDTAPSRAWALPVPQTSALVLGHDPSVGMPWLVVVAWAGTAPQEWDEPLETACRSLRCPQVCWQVGCEHRAAPPCPRSVPGGGLHPSIHHIPPHPQQ